MRKENKTKERIYDILEAFEKANISCICDWKVNLRDDVEYYILENFPEVDTSGDISVYEIIENEGWASCGCCGGYTYKYEVSDEKGILFDVTILTEVRMGYSTSEVVWPNEN